MQEPLSIKLSERNHVPELGTTNTRAFERTTTLRSAPSQLPSLPEAATTSRGMQHFLSRAAAVTPGVEQGPFAPHKLGLANGLPVLGAPASLATTQRPIAAPFRDGSYAMAKPLSSRAEGDGVSLNFLSTMVLDNDGGAMATPGKQDGPGTGTWEGDTTNMMTMSLGMSSMFGTMSQPYGAMDRSMTQTAAMGLGGMTMLQRGGLTMMGEGGPNSLAMTIAAAMNQGKHEWLSAEALQSLEDATPKASPPLGERGFSFDGTTINMNIPAVKSPAEVERELRRKFLKDATVLEGEGKRSRKKAAPPTLSQELLRSQRLEDEAMDSGGINKEWSDEQEFRRMIRKLRQNTVDLFHHAVHGAKSIRYTVDLLTEEAWTPEEKYHRMVALGEKEPWALTLRKSMCPTSIDLSNRGIGDDLGTLLASTLVDYPRLISLNVSHCNLTDKSLVPLLGSVIELPQLEFLDLGGNDIDDSSTILRNFLEYPECRLRRLGLNNADVDDTECGRVMASMRENRTLTSLDLAQNTLGHGAGAAEDGMVFPGGRWVGGTGRRGSAVSAMAALSSGFTAGPVHAALAQTLTGALSIAEMLRLNDTLLDLDLSGNMLRDNNAVTIARAVKDNKGLTRLNLADNNFGDWPAQQLGSSLRFNRSLKTLNLGYNGLTGHTAIVFANTVALHNKTLERITLVGNSLGARAVRALFRAIRLAAHAGRQVIIEVVDTDYHLDDPAVFDISDPHGVYTLDLSLPLDYATAGQLHHAAVTSLGSNFSSVVLLSDNGNGNPTEEVIELVKRTRADANAHSDARTAATRLVHIQQQRGVIYPEELGAFMRRLGLQPGRDMVWRIGQLIPSLDLNETTLLKAIFIGIFREVDSDRSGQISLDEFMLAMKMLGLGCDEEVAKQHMVEYDIDRSGTMGEPEFIMYMLERFSVRVEEFSQTTTLINAVTGQPWVIPEAGKLKVEFVFEAIPTTFNQVTTETAVRSILTNLKASSRSELDRGELFEAICLQSDLYFNSSQVLYLMKNLELGLEKVSMVALLLPQIVSYKAALQFIDHYMSLRQRFQLRKLVGNAFGPLMDIPTGHYVIDLADKWDRIAIRQLAKYNNKALREAVERKNGLGDTSQRGTGSSFRNETLNGIPLQLSSEWIMRSLPSTGILRFDFVSTIRPQVEIPPLGKRRFQQVLESLRFKGPWDEELVTHDTAFLNIRAHKTPTDEDVKSHRSAETASDTESVTKAGASLEAPSREDETFRELLYEDPMANLVEVLGTYSGLLLQYREFKATSYVRTVHRAMHQNSEEPLYEIALDEDPATTMDYPIHREKDYVRWLLKLCDLQFTAAALWLTCHQVYWFLSNFPSDDYIRIRALLLVFGKIIDLQNLDIVLDLLDPWERDELCHRVGCLNVYDGLSPEQTYNLHLDVYEDRQLCRMLTSLAVVEGIDSWTFIRYRISRRHNYTGLWKAPTSWVPDLLRQEGAFLPFHQPSNSSSQQQDRRASPAFHAQLAMHATAGLSAADPDGMTGFLRLTYNTTGSGLWTSNDAAAVDAWLQRRRLTLSATANHRASVSPIGAVALSSTHPRQDKHVHMAPPRHSMRMGPVGFEEGFLEAYMAAALPVSQLTHHVLTYTLADMSRKLAAEQALAQAMTTQIHMRAPTRLTVELDLPAGVVDLLSGMRHYKRPPLVREGQWDRASGAGNARGRKVRRGGEARSKEGRVRRPGSTGGR